MEAVMHDTSLMVPVIITGMLAIRMFLSVIWEGAVLEKSKVRR